MDPNLMSCNRCGHTSSQSAEVCTYCGAVFSDSGDAGKSEPDSAATGLSTTTPVSGATENVGLQETTEQIPPVPEPVEEILLDEPTLGIEIPQAPEIMAAEQAAAVEGEDMQEESVLKTIQSVSEPVAEPIDFSAAPAAESTKDQEKLVFELPSETAVTDLIPEDVLETAAAETGPELEQAAFKIADESPTDPEKPVTTAEASLDVISLVRELAVNSQPETSADASETELEVSIEPVQEEPKLVEQAEVGKSEQLEEVIEVRPEAEVTPFETDSKSNAQDGLGAADDQTGSELLELGDEIVAKPELVTAPDQPKESAVISELLTKAPVELDPKPEPVSGSKKEVSKAQIIALKKRKLAKIAALKKKRIALARAKALAKKKAALAKARALKKEIEKPAVSASEGKETQQMNAATTAAAAPRPGSGQGITGLLEKYRGQTIGVNYDNLAEIAEADLIEVNDAYFSVAIKDNKFQYSFPIKTILSIMEGEDGVEIGESEKKLKFNAVVKVLPVVLF